MKFWTLLAFVGLHWPFWPLWPWIIFLSKNWPFLIKIKHNWHVSNNQMLKSIFKGDREFQITVIQPRGVIVISKMKFEGVFLPFIQRSLISHTVPPKKLSQFINTRAEMSAFLAGWEMYRAKFSREENDSWEKFTELCNHSVLSSKVQSYRILSGFEIDVRNILRH